jgi:hypothetical protein
MPDTEKPTPALANPFTEALLLLTLGALREIVARGVGGDVRREVEFLRTIERGATFRVAIQDGMCYLVVDGRDVPVRFTEEQVKSALAVAVRNRGPLN